mmetsp:Transcript_45534/g.114725  ORF Transcript_45534/g.114725 Transcript_45534/m.114725 type:complete len:670 (+) Transcript_45534:52-2061(+)
MRDAARLQTAANDQEGAAGEDQQLPTTFLGLRLWVEQEVQAHVKMAMRELQVAAAQTPPLSTTPRTPPTSARRSEASVGDAPRVGRAGVETHSTLISELLEEQHRQAAELRDLRQAMLSGHAASTHAVRKANAASSSAAAVAATRASEQRLHAMNLNVADQAKRLRRLTEDVASANESIEGLRGEVQSAITSAASATAAAAAAVDGHAETATARNKVEERRVAELREDLLRHAGALAKENCAGLAGEVARQTKSEWQAEAGRLWDELRSLRYLFQGIGEKGRCRKEPRTPSSDDAREDVADRSVPVLEGGASAKPNSGRIESPLVPSWTTRAGSHHQHDILGVDWDNALAAAQAHLRSEEDHFRPPLGHYGGNAHFSYNSSIQEFRQEPSPPPDLGWDEVLLAARSQLGEQGGSPQAVARVAEVEAMETFGVQAERDEELELAFPQSVQPGSRSQQLSPAKRAVPRLDDLGDGSAGEDRLGDRHRGSLRGLAAAALAGRTLMESARELGLGSPLAAASRTDRRTEDEDSEIEEETAPPSPSRTRLSDDDVSQSNAQDARTRSGQSRALAAAALAGRALAEGITSRSRRRWPAQSALDASGSEAEDGDRVASAAKRSMADAAAKRRRQRAAAVAAAAGAGRTLGHVDPESGTSSPTFGARRRNAPSLFGS